MRLFAALVLGAACSTTTEGRGVTPGKGQGAASGETIAPVGYENPSASWSGYTRAIVMPTRVRVPERASEAEVQEMEALNDSLHAVLVRELGQVLEIVTEPGPGTLRVEASMFDGGRKLSGIEVMSAVGGEAGDVVAASRGTPLSVRELGAELKATDAVSGEVIADLVEPRLGAAFNTWGEAYDALERWAKQARAALCARGTGKCPGA